MFPSGVCLLAQDFLLQDGGFVAYILHRHHFPHHHLSRGGGQCDAWTANLQWELHLGERIEQEQVGPDNPRNHDSNSRLDRARSGGSTGGAGHQGDGADSVLRLQHLLLGFHYGPVMASRWGPHGHAGGQYRTKGRRRQGQRHEVT